MWHILYLSFSVKHHRSRHVFFVYMSLLFFVRVIHTSKYQSENALYLRYIYSKLYRVSYLLYGLNVVHCLFLFAFKFHFCKKSNLSRKTNGNCMTHGENNIQGDSHKQDQHGSRQSYDTLSDSAITVQVCKSLESEYDEIDAKLLINNVQFSQNVFRCFRTPSISSKYLLRSTGWDYPIKDVRVEHNLK